MSTTRTTSFEVSAEEFRAIELEPIGYPLPSHDPKSVPGRSEIQALDKAHASTEPLTNDGIPPLSKWRATVIVGTVACVTLVNSMLAGILVVSPEDGKRPEASHALLLWPASVSALACGCTLLISGSIADVVGGRKICMWCLENRDRAGALPSGSRLGIIFMPPSSVILITGNIPLGSWRNTAFACLGAGQPVGFSVGLVIGGIFVQSIGWRYGYYIGAVLTFATFIISLFGIPPEPASESQPFLAIWTRIRTEIDWVGCMLLSTSLGMFSSSIALFSIAVVLVPLFAFHVHRQERLGLKAIIPPSLWGNRVFASLCITVFLIWGVFNAIEFFLTLFYQDVQSLSGIQTSIRFLPMVVTGTATNFITGWLVKRVRADVLVLGSAAITSISPLLMAIAKPEWSYWTCAFMATACAPICADVLFTVANLLITSVFPPQTHGLAGGVFNTISNIGNSVGLAVTAVVASSVTLAEKGDPADTLIDGYRASFWLCFAANVLVLGIVAFGLRRIGKVGIKVD